MPDHITIAQVLTQLEGHYPAPGSDQAWMLRTFVFGEADPWAAADVERGGLPLPHTFSALTFDHEPTLNEMGPGEFRTVRRIDLASMKDGVGDLSAVASAEWRDAIKEHYPAWRPGAATTASATLGEVEAGELDDIVRGIRQVEVPESVRSTLRAAGFTVSDGELLVREGDVALDVRATFGAELVKYDDWVMLSSDSFGERWRGPAERVTAAIADVHGADPRLLVARLNAQH